ncbi:aminoglycoside phosphotransferase family protein [Streptomyces sp. 549]|uniref:aminoglycoside phosphotransferase family protein n=1 Tax=Streptomyces sp. 549 TaxID=3049076 RepID=UPI0024C35DC2|nr:aminoglycoside phosphotransferase family protein [Streptomyces sp. 549]MDK1476195.1 aminoglycoside phosphotransferase family protein [Streptomyces sp. 549]
MKPPQSFEGYHRTWHVLGPYKYAEPHDGALWFDRRCFRSENELLAELAALGTGRVPAVGELAPGMTVQSFVPGESLYRRRPRGTPVPYLYRRQIMSRFRHLASLRPSDVASERSCEAEARPADGDTTGFLRALLSYAHRETYLARLPEYGTLFERLGITGAAVDRRSWLHREAGRLTPRPFCLLHGDLHRENLIVDRWRRLWTIDWELAMVGDPLYDLATHLYLMDYPDRQRKPVITAWRKAVTAELPGADAGLSEDLPRYLDYKRVQSVYTDVVRQSHRRLTPHTATVVLGVLRRAADLLGVDESDLPTRRQITAAYAEHARSRAAARTAAETAATGTAVTGTAATTAEQPAVVGGPSSAGAPGYVR